MDGGRTSDDALTREDISRLIDRSYLTERLVMLAAQKLTKDFTSSAARWFRLANGTPMSFPRQEDQLLSVLRPLLRSDSSGLRYCLLPVFESSHWTLFILVLSSTEIQVVHVDSIPPRRPRFLVRSMEKLLSKLIHQNSLWDIVDVQKTQSLTQPTCAHPPDSGLYVLSAIEAFRKAMTKQRILHRSSDFIQYYSKCLLNASVIQRGDVLALLNLSHEIQQFWNLGDHVEPLTPSSVVQALPRDAYVAGSLSGSQASSVPASPTSVMEAMSLSPTSEEIKREPEGYYVLEASSPHEVIVIEDDSDDTAGSEDESSTDHGRGAADGDAIVARAMSPMTGEAESDGDVDYEMPSAEEDDVNSDAISSAGDELESKTDEGSGEDDESASVPDSNSESTGFEDVPWQPTPRLARITAATPPRASSQRHSRTSTNESNRNGSQSAQPSNDRGDGNEHVGSDQDVPTSTVARADGPVRKKQKLSEPTAPPEWNQWIKPLGNFDGKPITYQECLAFKALRKTKGAGDVNVEMCASRADPIVEGEALTRKNALLMYELGLSTKLPHELIGEIVGYKTSSVNSRLSLMRSIFKKIDNYNASLQDEST